MTVRRSTWSLPRAVTAFACVFLTSACARSVDRSSSDIQALRNRIAFDMPATVGTWEIFGTPEYTGGLPGPTDFVTLVAEFDKVDPAWTAQQRGSVGKAWVAPESPRPWLSQRYRTMFEGARDDLVDLTNDQHCHPYLAQVRKSGRAVHGFTCNHGGRVLLYLRLREPPTA